jgi:dynein heavy chain
MGKTLESRKFRAVDKLWCQLMAQVQNNPYVMRIMGVENLLSQLRDSNEKMEHLLRDLDHYLGRKREQFYRFYFLSNDDLIELLSQSKEPTAIQPHLPKLFQTVSVIHFDNSCITAFGDKDNLLTIHQPVPTADLPIEEWAQHFEEAIKSEVRRDLTTTLINYNLANTYTS